MHTRVVWLVGLCLLAGRMALGHGGGSVAYIPNKGQWPGAFQYRATLAQVSLFVQPGALRVAMTAPMDHTPKRPASHLPKAFAWEIKWLNANPDATPDHRQTAANTVNYFLGNAAPVTTQPVEELALPGTYPGATLLYHSRNEQAAFDFELEPGADASRIAFAIEGAKSSINLKGQIEIATPYGAVLLTQPVAWQADGKPVACSFSVSRNGYGFKLGTYDKRQRLTIDPSLIFSTYSGSRADNWGSTATYDKDGNMFTGGTVFDRGYPVTLGAIDTTYRSAVDIGIIKYASDGRRLLWATYLGGNRSETPSSLVCGADGSLYIMASTGSSDFPTTAGAYDRTFNGGPSIDPMGYSFIDYWYPNGSDFSLTRISADGRTLIGSTFLGGSGNDGLLDQPDNHQGVLTSNYGDQFRGEIVLDNRGRVCLAGTTNSINFPTTAQMRPGQALGNGDAVVARLSPDLSRLLNAGLIGGNQPDACFGITADTLGNCYVVGGTMSANLRATTGVVKAAYGGNVDGFVAAIDSGWGQANALSYLGSASYDQAYLVQTDRQGLVYVLGQNANGYPVTAGVYSFGTSGQFIHCLTPDFRNTIFSTRICPAAGGFTSPTAFLVDDCGRIYASAWGGNTNQGANYVGGTTLGLPTTSDAFKRVSDGSDFYLMVLEPGASSLAYGTFMGSDSPNGEHVDGGTSRFDKKGVVYQSVCGCGGSTFPTTPGAWSRNNNSNNCNNLGFKFDFSLLKADFVATPQNANACVPFTLNLRNRSVFATRYQWRLSTGDTSTQSDTSLNFTVTRPGPVRVVLRAFNPATCVRVDSAVRFITANAVEARPDTVMRLCQSGQALQLANPSLPGYRFSWSSLPAGADTALPSQTVQPAGAVSYRVRVRSPQGCVANRQFNVLDHRLNARIAPDSLVGCAPLAALVRPNAYQARTLRWEMGNGDAQTNADTTQLRYTYQQPGRFVLKLTVYNDTTCVSSFSDSIVVRTGILIKGRDTVQRLCQDNGVVVMTNPLLPGYRYRWPAHPDIIDTTAPNQGLNGLGSIGTYAVKVRSPEGCVGTRTFQVRDGRLSVAISQRPGPVCQDSVIRLAAIGVNLIDTNLIWTSPPQILWRGPNLRYANPVPGVYLVKLQVQNDSACIPMAYDSVLVEVLARPALDDTLIRFCPGDQVTLLPPADTSIYIIWPGGQRGGSFLQTANQQGSFDVTLGNRGGCRARRVYNFDYEMFVAKLAAINTFDACNNRYTIAYRNLTDNYDGQQWKVNGDEISTADSGLFTTEPLPGQPELDLMVSRRGCRAYASFPLAFTGQPITFNPNWSITPLYRNCADLPQARLNAQASTADSVWFLVDGVKTYGKLNTLAFDDSAAKTIWYVQAKQQCYLTQSQTFTPKPVNVGNVLTPNGDGRNEKLINLPQAASWKLSIADRWGSQAASGTAGALNWPATNSKPGTYFYNLRNGEGLNCSGWVEVVR